MSSTCHEFFAAYITMVSFPYSLFFPLTLPSFLVLFCTFPFTVGASDIARIICSHETACTDLGLARAPIAKASLPLAANDSVADCHRFCTLVLEETESSPCKFTYPNGSCLSLVVLDDDGKILSLIISQCSRLIVCAVCAWQNVSILCHCLLPPIVISPPPLLPSLPTYTSISTDHFLFPSSRIVSWFFLQFWTSPWRQWPSCAHLAVKSGCRPALHSSSWQQTHGSRGHLCHRWVLCLLQKENGVGLNITDVDGCGRLSQYN